MTKICFPTKVKYNGNSFPPFSPFEVTDSDLHRFLESGAWIVKESVTYTEEKEESKKPVKKTAKAKKNKEV